MSFKTKPLELKVKYPKIPKFKKPNNKYYKKAIRGIRKDLLKG